MVEKVQRVKVWGGWLRFSHLAMGLAILFLMATGWLLDIAPAERASWVEIHYISASVLIFAVLLRLLLLFVGQPVERLSSLVPDENEWQAMLDTLKFYLTLGKAPLPRWYAHNPLWKPVYLLSYFVLLILIATGALQVEYAFLGGYYMPLLHANFAPFIAWFVFLHVFAVVLHDYRGNAADASSIINGHRHYVIEKTETVAPVQETAVRIDKITWPKAPQKLD